MISNHTQGIPKKPISTAELREEIARLINYGLSNVEIYGQIPTCYPADLIAVIRDIMTEKH